MAKELPYFRFTVAEWLNGSISFEDYELKGFFIDLCAFYWFNDCNLSLDKAEKRFRNELRLIEKLKKGGILKIDGRTNKIRLTFLDDQLELLSGIRKARQKAGSKGGKAPKQSLSKAKAQLKQKVSYKDKDKDRDNINLLYSLYPAKCPVSNRSTGKSSKDKDKLKRLLKTETVENLSAIIDRYVKECVRDEVYLKNFSTLLNNLPDYGDESPEVNYLPPINKIAAHAAMYAPPEMERLLKKGYTREQVEHYAKEGA